MPRLFAGSSGRDLQHAGGLAFNLSSSPALITIRLYGRSLMNCRHFALGLFGLFAGSLALSGPVMAQQQPGADFPEGAGKSDVVAICGGCHDINRLKAGYTAEGWHTVMRMMENF